MGTRAAVRRSRKDRAELLAKSPRLQRIVEELEALFFKEGFLHIHTEELAHRLHCSKQTLYTLAQSRDELFEVILERFLSGIRTQAQKAAAEATDRVTALAGCLDAIRHAVSKVSVRFAEDLNEFPRGQRRRREHEDLMASLLADIISSGAQEGAFQSVHPRLTAEILIRGAARIVQPSFLSHGGLSLTQAFNEFHKFYLHGLLRPEASGPGKDQDGGHGRQRPVNVVAFR
jgi:AcrR family transcriptional regulator